MNENADKYTCVLSRFSHSTLQPSLFNNKLIKQTLSRYNIIIVHQKIELELYYRHWNNKFWEIVEFTIQYSFWYPLVNMASKLPQINTGSQSQCEQSCNLRYGISQTFTQNVMKQQNQIHPLQQKTWKRRDQGSASTLPSQQFELPFPC